MLRRSIFYGTLKIDFGFNNRSIFAPKNVKRSVVNRATSFSNSLYKKDWNFGKNRPLKNRLLQCYEVPWIHNIETIFTSEYRKYFIVSRAYSNFLTFILRVYFPEGLLSRGLTLIQLNYFCGLTIETIRKCFTKEQHEFQNSKFMELVKHFFVIINDTFIKIKLIYVFLVFLTSWV